MSQADFVDCKVETYVIVRSTTSKGSRTFNVIGPLSYSTVLEETKHRIVWDPKYRTSPTHLDTYIQTKQMMNC